MIGTEEKLFSLASNFYSEWHPEIRQIFELVDPQIPKIFQHNYYQFLCTHTRRIFPYQYRLIQLLTQELFCAKVHEEWVKYNSYMSSRATTVDKIYPELRDQTIAYFSMEYGLLTLPIYSGGLGILSGDHLRGASDIGLTMVGIGLFYMDCYYEQSVDLQGHMQVSYLPMVAKGKYPQKYLPITQVKNQKGKTLTIEIPIGDRVIYCHVWKVHIGRSELLLLDTDLNENSLHDRHISRRLYASQYHRDAERRRRLEQEIVLGIGGMKALEGAGYQPGAYHLNEGHVALALLESIRINMIQKKLSFEDAQSITSRKFGFTTHTPVPEGNERFQVQLVHEMLEPYLRTFLDSKEIQNVILLGTNSDGVFDMTQFSLRLAAAHRNGVSRLHGEVCRNMWAHLWDVKDPQQTPIDSITNAIHIPFWIRSELSSKFDNQNLSNPLAALSDQEIWDLHQKFKSHLIEKVRERCVRQWRREGLSGEQIMKRYQTLPPENTFIIGFARRFAQYKRVTLILDDEDRLFEFLHHAYEKYKTPISFIFAGKPHPDNHPGRNRVHQISEVSRRLERDSLKRGYQAYIVFVEGYDITLARLLESGADIWLNNPIRPLEASGTSGMKAGLHGVLNVSINDGWVCEGIQNDINGWTFGAEPYESNNQDRNALFELLESIVLPRYFDFRDHNFSEKWVTMMRSSILTILRDFNSDRMLREYIEKMYLPAVQS